MAAKFAKELLPYSISYLQMTVFFFSLKSIFALYDYERDNGQAINLKSGIFFNNNLWHQSHILILISPPHYITISTPLNTERYLGLPSMIGRRKREIFAYLRLRDKLRSRTQGWQGKLPSQAGREILVKAVGGQSIPPHIAWPSSGYQKPL